MSTFFVKRAPTAASGKHCNINRHFRKGEHDALYHKVFDPFDGTSVVSVTANGDLSEIYGDMQQVTDRGEIHPLLGLACFKANWQWHTARHVLGFLAYAHSHIENLESRQEQRR